ncbi:hypothetical protein [Streptomyces malaysiensis]|uniref:Uncharacterized protein n=1 Tax=Streptomyces malaysiensis TaxID=92644 RepID=A0A7X5WXB4_STRMQ|nr:hypothetical protein [Streptomyces malaysiensis]NIY62687.1 hypothetical protein [Streptomyces malaysiensis]
MIAESVNPLALARDAWRDVAVRVGVAAAEIESVCPDPAERKRRASQRTVDIPGLPLPTWTDTTDRAYEPWHRDHHVIDTAGRGIADCSAPAGVEAGGGRHARRRPRSWEKTAVFSGLRRFSRSSRAY